LHGFAPMETPAFERIETLSGKYGEEGDKLIFKILKRGEQAATGEVDLALRYDLTVPAMRVFAHRKNELPRPFKRYQIGPVWRADRPGRGRFREFYQCDVDVIGSASLRADVAVILALGAALSAVGLENFVFRLNSRHVIKAMMDAYGVPEPLQAQATTVLDKWDKIGRDGVSAELAELGLADAAVQELCDDLGGDTADAAIRARLQTSEQGRKGLAEVDTVIAHAAPRLAGGSLRFDPLLARGLDYYTGPIYEIFAEGFRGSVGGGGRYDNLAQMFQRESVPVCGGSLGIERILMLLAKDKAAPVPHCDAYITVWDDAALDRALTLADDLRAAGVRAEIDLDGGRLGRQFKTADQRHCRIALVEGPDEQAAGTVVIKNLATGTQTTHTRAGAPRAAAEMLADTD